MVAKQNKNNIDKSKQSESKKSSSKKKTAYCPYCGEINYNIDAKFCMHCGFRFRV